MPFKFIERTRERKQAKQADAVATYRRLVGIAADIGDLSDDDGDQLAAAAGSIGLAMEADEDAPSITHHAAMIREEKQLAQDAAGFAKAEEKYRRAREDMAAFNAETERLIAELTEQRKQGRQQREDKMMKAHGEQSAAQTAASKLTVIRSRLRDYDRIIDGGGAEEIANIGERWAAQSKRFVDRQTAIAQTRPMADAEEMAAW